MYRYLTCCLVMVALTGTTARGAGVNEQSSPVVSTQQGDEGDATVAEQEVAQDQSLFVVDESQLPEPTPEVAEQKAVQPEAKSSQSAHEARKEGAQEATDAAVKEEAPQQITQQAQAQQEQEVQEKAEPQEVGKHEEQQQAVDSIPEIVGIDTVNVESASGNWLLKRIWFERAQEQYEVIRGLFDKVLEARLVFFAKRTELDRSLFDPFYMNIGIGQGELLEILGRLLQDLEEVRKVQGALTAEENVLYETVEQEKATLQQLQKEVTGVTEIDSAIEMAIAQLIEQVNVCRGYEKQAWETFKEIGRQLSDKKARELYYVMETYRKNSTDIVTYLQQDFARYMQELERVAHEHIERILATVAELKKKDIDFKQQALRLERKRQGKEVKEIAEEEVEVEEPGFVGRVWATMVDAVSSLMQMVTAGLEGMYRWIWPYASDEEETAVEPLVQPKVKQSL